jgi:hypothetical protein
MTSQSLDVLLTVPQSTRGNEQLRRQMYLQQLRNVEDADTQRVESVLSDQKPNAYADLVVMPFGELMTLRKSMQLEPLPRAPLINTTSSVPRDDVEPAISTYEHERILFAGRTATVLGAGCFVAVLLVAIVVFIGKRT